MRNTSLCCCNSLSFTIADGMHSFSPAYKMKVFWRLPSSFDADRKKITGIAARVREEERCWKKLILFPCLMRDLAGIKLQGCSWVLTPTTSIPLSMRLGHACGTKGQSPSIIFYLESGCPQWTCALHCCSTAQALQSLDLLVWSQGPQEAWLIVQCYCR